MTYNAARLADPHDEDASTCGGFASQTGEQGGSSDDTTHQDESPFDPDRYWDIYGGTD